MSAHLNNEQKVDMLREAGFADKVDIFDKLDSMKEVDVWKPPIPFDSITVPGFPVNELPVNVANYVNAVAETTQTAPDMAATAALAILALCLQKKYVIEGKPDWQEQLSLYAIVGANPAERKSAVISLMSEPIKQFEADENKRLALAIERNRTDKNILEKKRKLLEEKVAHGKTERSELDEIVKKITEFEEIKPCKLFCDDITPERLSGILNENDGRTAILSSEGGIFDLLAGRYSESINIDVFLKAHSGDSIRVDRQVRAKEYVRNPALTTLIFAQPNVIENLMANEIFRSRGLYARFIYSIPVSTVGSRRFKSSPISPVTAEQYYNLIETLLRVKNDAPKVVKLSEKVSSMFQKFYEKVEPMLVDELADIVDFAGKFVGMTLRIAGLLYLADDTNYNNGDLLLSESYMRSAIIIGKYFLEHAKVVYKIMGSDEVIGQCQYILRQLQKSKPERVKSYPNLEIVSRNGSITYKNAIEAAHPQAMQISDRFHLLKNLTKYAMEYLKKKLKVQIVIPSGEKSTSCELSQSNKNRKLTVAEKYDKIVELKRLGLKKTQICKELNMDLRFYEKLVAMTISEREKLFKTNFDISREEKIESKMQRINEVRKLKAAGFSIRAISRRTKLDHRTAAKYIKEDFAPIHAAYDQKKGCVLIPYMQEIDSMLEVGMMGTDITQKITENGYTNSYTTVRRYIANWKKRRKHLYAIDNQTNGKTDVIQRNDVFKLLFYPLEKVQSISSELFHKLCDEYPCFQNLNIIIWEFIDSLQAKNPDELASWIQRAKSLKIREIDSFVDGVKHDYAAVFNAIKFDYSNGLAEGKVNKLKLIKRIMYGRCRFSTLKTKVLLIENSSFFN